MGAKPSCMRSDNEPNVQLKVRASCCNKTIKVHIDEKERINELFAFIQTLSKDELKENQT